MLDLFFFSFCSSFEFHADGEYIRAPGRAPRLCMPRKEPVPGERRKEKKRVSRRPLHKPEDRLARVVYYL